MKRYRYRYSLLLIFVFALNVVFAQEASPCRVDANTVFNLDWNPSGDTLAFGSNCGVLLLNDRLDQLTGVLPLDSARDMASVAFNHNGTLIAASVRYQEGSQPSISIIIWDAQTNSVVRILEGQFSSIPIAWHPSQDIFVFGYDEEMLFYDMQSSMVVFQFNPSYSDEIMGNYPTLACWSPQGSYVLLSFMYAPEYLITFPPWPPATAIIGGDVDLPWIQATGEADLQLSLQSPENWLAFVGVGGGLDPAVISPVGGSGYATVGVSLTWGSFFDFIYGVTQNPTIEWISELLP